MKIMTKNKPKTIAITVIAVVLALSVFLGIYDLIIPDNISYRQGSAAPDYMGAFAFSDEATSTVGGFCSTTAEYRLLGILPIKSVKLTAVDDIKLYVGGMPFGIKFFTKGVLVVGFFDVEGQDGTKNPAQASGLKERDIITHINGKEISSTNDMTKTVESSDGSVLRITYLRGKDSYTASITPILDKNDGKYKTGIWAKDSGAGIGTISFILPDSNYFVGLGHGICDPDSGELLPIERGTVMDVTISGLTKGICGTPGEIKGFFGTSKTGMLLGNTSCGVYGILTTLPNDTPLESLPIAIKSEVKEGAAKIRCTLDTGEMKEYSISISNINRNSTSGKSFTVTVTDPDLIAKTGGIIQGMSGSPILQDGKIVGAVTHVLINDPTRGYGIFVENMLGILPD